MSIKDWNFAKAAGDFKLYDDFDDGNLDGWALTDHISINSEQVFDGSGYSMKLGDATDNGYADKDFDPVWDVYDDLYLVVLFKVMSTTDGDGLVVRVTHDGANLQYCFGDDPSFGDILHQVSLGVWYAYVLPVSADFFNLKTYYPGLNRLRLSFNTDSVIYVKWIGIFREADLSDHYCIGTKCGNANNVSSGIRDCDNDDVYLKTTNSDLTIEEDTDLTGENQTLTVYHSIGSGMKLKVTVSWEIGDIAQTDHVFYCTTGASTEENLGTECPNIDKVTNIKIENVAA